MVRWTEGAYAVIVLLLLTSSSPAEVFDGILDNDPDQPWHIVSDEISYDEKAACYIAKGNVVISKDEKNLVADFVRFDYKSMLVLATGRHVIMTTGEDIIAGTRIKMDLKSETGTIDNGSIFLKKNHFHIKGDKIQKTGKNTYAVDRAFLSTCDGGNPDWKITGRKLKVKIEGYGLVSHAALWVKKIPVFYSPLLVFPAKLKRQSGLLLPQIGHSDRKGTEYTQPFYWAINESSDATFYEHYMSRRGHKAGLEYRYMLDEVSQGTIMYDYLHDKKTDDGTQKSSDDWGYEDDNWTRPNSDRYWFRMKHNHALPYGTDYPWYNPIWPESAATIVTERGAIRMYGAIHQTRRGFIHRSGLDPYNHPGNNEWEFRNFTYHYDGEHSSTGYNKDYHYDKRFLFISPLDYPKVYKGLGEAAFTSLEQFAWYFKPVPKDK